MVYGPVKKPGERVEGISPSEAVVAELYRSVSETTLQHWHEMLGEIQCVRVQYSMDQLEMSDNAIRAMRMLAIRMQTDIGEVLAGSFYEPN